MSAAASFFTGACVAYAADRHDLRRVISNLAVFDFDSPDRRMRLRSVHPWVSVDEVVEQTGFDLAIESDVAQTREPDADELRWIREVIDPKGFCNNEVPA